MHLDLGCVVRWYHGSLTRHAAEALLLSNGSDGSYLLRQSNAKALYTLSVRYRITKCLVPSILHCTLVQYAQS